MTVSWAMPVALVALAVAVVTWPVPRQVDLRLRGLVQADRLAAPGTSAPALRWRRVVRSRGLIGAVVLGLGAAGAAWRGPIVGVTCAGAAALVLAGVVRAAGRAVARSRDRDLSAALRMIRAELDVGSSGGVALAAAAAVAGSHAPAFTAAATAVADGSDIVSAVAAAGADPELIVIAQAWQLAATLGLPVADVLARVDDDVQARREQTRAVASALAGPRSSAALLAGLPVLGVVLGLAMGARPLQVLFDTRAGPLLLLAGCVFDAAGVLWTARLIRSAEQS
jgi:tight adherence protein B